MNKTLRTILLPCLLLAAACVTPQIPLPPPDPGILELAVVDPDAGSVQVKGKANDQTRDAIVGIWNDKAQRGVLIGASADGSFDSGQIDALDGDRLIIDYRRGEDHSDQTCVEVDYDSRSLPPCP